MAISLVTGGAGFIGAHLTNYLLQRGDTVVVLDDLSGGCIENIPAGTIFRQGSITDPAFVDAVFDAFKFDFVYHLAAYAAEGLSHFIRRFNYTNNLIGSVNLINASVRCDIKCFVFTSSIAVYGDNSLPHSEEQTPLPKDPYGIAKYAVELDLKNAKELFGLNSIVFRPHNVYGPNQNIGDKYRNVVGIFMNQCLKNEPRTIFGDGKQTRAFTFVEDIVPQLADAVLSKKNYNQTFNLGAEERLSIGELASLVSETMNVPNNINYLDQREEAEHAYASHTKQHLYFGVPKSTSLQDGIQKMADWVKKHGAKESISFKNIELLKNLPNSWK